ncbi:rhamnogalacturonan acetylesterase [Pontibacter sp. E15-1]|uniref:rhamnogalacturonan acetylesterase n=1 Tax=Pontibacter sp. E15-1 TaxID=2919918 RepID=UPI001F4F508E|nr:rhamnogalacturonan acetylesterase [Pontibacter sp. E15-1]MCJ8165939.1 rhamnogalacturonan acetylesterase [Pontibacter sp. E15-1]
MMLRKNIPPFFAALLVLAVLLFGFTHKQKPTLYIIGDSTVRNTGEGYGGWGSYIQELFDTTRISVSNQAMAGRSTRTFIKEGRWEKVLSTLKPGDFVIMQFGHNEGSAPDTSRAGYRGVLRGTGPETKELTWKDGEKEVVHTYGWYLSKFVKEAKEKGATPIIASMIPRNQWKDGKVVRADNDFGKWAREVAQAEGVYFVDLNRITAEKYEAFGPEKVDALFPSDHTHTSPEGARINAASVVDGLKQNKRHPLNKYLLKKPR